jgi:aspartate aminotransferase-like enzyme
VEHGVVLAGGQGSLADKIFRIGHIGWVSEADIDDTLRALRIVLSELSPAPAR